MEKKRNAKGEGSFTINSDGTITHRKSCGYKPNGHRKILTVTATSKTACIREMKKKEAEWNEEKSATAVQVKDTVAGLCYKHLDYQVENEELKHKSIDRRECTIVNQIEKYDIGKLQVASISSSDIEKHIRLLIKEGRLSESSITKTLDVLNSAFAWAVLQGDLKENPVESVKPKLVKKLKKLSAKEAEEADVSVFSDEELEIFVDEVLKEDSEGRRLYIAGDYLLFLLYTGMRCGELFCLRWKDVDWEAGVLTIHKSASMAKNRDKKSDEDNNFIMLEGTTKNQKARMIQLMPEAKVILRNIYASSKWTGENDLIAPTRTGKMNTASNLEHRMKVILKNAGLTNVQGGLHTFRKTFATQMYERGMRVEEIAAYIGDLESTTRKYYIAIRKKLKTKDGVKQVVKIPENVLG